MRPKPAPTSVMSSPKCVVTVDQWDQCFRKCCPPTSLRLRSSEIRSRFPRLPNFRFLESASQALARLGSSPSEIPIGPQGSQHGPWAFVGSITHAAGIRWVRSGARGRILRRGGRRGAEPTDWWRPFERCPLLLGIRSVVALRGAGSSLCWDRLLFSAKEAVFKSWYLLTSRTLEFDDGAASGA